VYPPGLLSPEERQNLLRFRWVPLAPVGISGSDYVQRTLYLRNTVEERAIEERIVPAGLEVRRGVRALVPLPETPGRVRLWCAAVCDVPSPVPPDPLVVRWYGKGLEKRWTKTLDPVVPGAAYHFSVSGGQLELDCPRHAIFHVAWNDRAWSADHEPLDITPSREYLLVFRTDEQASVEYAIRPSADRRRTPFRLWLYGLLENHEPDGGQSADERFVTRLGWQFLDASGSVVEQGTLADCPPVSDYDYVADAADDLRVTDRCTFYFAIPSDVCRVRLSAIDRPSLVCGFTRPPGLPKEVRVPEDYYAYHREHGLRRSWYNVQPSSPGEMSADEQLVRLVIQPRPPEDDPLLLAGQFQWRDYHPEGAWKARYLLVARDPTSPTSREAPRTLFTELDINREHVVQFTCNPGRGRFSPTLVYRTDDALPQTITIRLEGQLHEQFRVYAPSGHLRLEGIPRELARQPSRVQILAAPTTQVCMNGIALDGQPTYWKRLANRLEDGRLSFIYSKQQEEELLTLRFFPITCRSARLRLHVTISGSGEMTSGPHADLTLRHRIYDLRPGEQPNVWVLEAPQTLTGGGLSCYLPLGADLPPGRYAIEVSTEDAVEGYVLLSRTIPGRAQTRAIFLDRSEPFTPDPPRRGPLACFP
jgi:hypothetical protein